MEISNKKFIASPKKALITLAFFLFCCLIMSLTLRGNSGNPDAGALNTPAWTSEGPLELSPDRGRFALLYSVVEDKSVKFSISLARFATPDLAVNKNGEYVSLFAPGVSFLAIPGYVIGRYFGASQVGAFAIIALVAVFNMLLIRAISMRLGASAAAASIGAGTFAFATPAFAYAVSFYQHHISVFLILLSIYCLLRWNNWWSAALVWILCGFSITVDYPNLFLMLPVGLYALGRIFFIDSGNSESKLRLNFNPLRLLSLFAIIVPVMFFLWFNNASYADPFQLSGTLPRVEALDAAGKPVDSSDIEEDIQSNPNKKQAINFFKTRHLLNGFYTHLFSPDRGIIIFAPVIIIGLFGIFFIYKVDPDIANVLLAILGIDILLYSMWGDPYGGWAFGSRYLIPAYGLLGIGISFVLTRWKRNMMFLLIFFGILTYSSWVNTLGALTSNANPPKVEILDLEKKTGRVQKYTYARNLDYLKKDGSKSFAYREIFESRMDSEQYFRIVFMLIAIFNFILVNRHWMAKKNNQYE
jgi:hypothetical protein